MPRAKCQECGQFITYKNHGASGNVMKTHILTKCKKATAEKKAFWRSTPY